MYGCVEIGRLVSDWRGLYVICATCIDSSMATIRREPPIVPSIVMNGVKPTTTEEPVHTRPSNCGHGMNDQES